MVVRAEPEAAPTSFCTDLSCATRHTAKEPSWADLTFQPSIDWKGVRGHGTGVRGDCVATELEYIMPKYCDPTPRAGPFPSLERLASVDVHSAGLAQGGMAELVRLMGNRSLLVRRAQLDAAPWSLTPDRIHLTHRASHTHR